MTPPTIDSVRRGAETLKQYCSWSCWRRWHLFCAGISRNGLWLRSFSKLPWQTDTLFACIQLRNIEADLPNVSKHLLILMVTGRTCIRFQTSEPHWTFNSSDLTAALFSERYGNIVHSSPFSNASKKNLRYFPSGTSTTFLDNSLFYFIINFGYEFMRNGLKVT
jgi:hypothetical protein